MKKIVDGYVFKVEDKLIGHNTKKTKRNQKIYFILFVILALLFLAVYVIAGDTGLLGEINNPVFNIIRKYGVYAIIVLSALTITLVFFRPTDINCENLEIVQDIQNGNISNIQCIPETRDDNEFTAVGTLSYEKFVDHKRIYKKYNVKFDFCADEDSIEIGEYSIWVNSIWRRENETAYYEKMCKKYNISVPKDENSNEYKAGFVAGLCQVITLDETNDYDSAKDIVDKILNDKFQ